MGKNVFAGVLASALLALAIGPIAASVKANGPPTNGPPVDDTVPIIVGAHLSGAEEVPAVETLAQGQVTFEFTDEGDAIYDVSLVDHRLIVANIENVVAAHIHCAPAGQNGAIGVTLFMGGPVTVNGILTQGPIMSPDPGNTCGWADMADVLADVEIGNAYVNVHTTANPPGEIRGQLVQFGPRIPGPPHGH